METSTQGNHSCDDAVYGSNKPVQALDSETDDEDEDLEEDNYSTPEPDASESQAVADLRAENSTLKQASTAANWCHLQAQPACRLEAVSWLLIPESLLPCRGFSK